MEAVSRPLPGELSLGDAPRVSRANAPRAAGANAACVPARSADGAAPATEGDPLLLAAQRGDDRALGAIIEAHRGAVYGYLRARLLEPADAEDLAQEVFLRCCNGQAEMRRATALRPWLIGIARNVLREHVRGLTRRKEVLWTELCLELDSWEQPVANDEHEALVHLGPCLESLGHSARQALDLYYGQQLRLARIGELLARSEGGVKLLLFRSRQALKNCLDHRLRAERHA